MMLYQSPTSYSDSIMAMKLAKINLFQLSAARTIGLKEAVPSGDRHPTIGDHPGLCRGALLSIKPFHFFTAWMAGARCAASWCFSASRLS